jgi:serralysin
MFDTKPSKASNLDRLYDFDPTYDSIRLDNKIFTALGPGNASNPKTFTVDMFVRASKAQDQEDRIVYDKATGALSYDADGTGAAAQVRIATLGKSLKLGHQDFFVV